MPDLKQQLSSLVQDLSCYLKQDYSSDEWLSTSTEDYAFYLQLAQSQPVSKRTVTATAPAPARPMARPVTAAKRKPLAPRTAKKETKSNEPVKKQVKLEPLTQSKGRTAQEFKQFLSPIADRISIIETIPDDGLAKERAQRWRRTLSPQTVLLLHREEDAQGRQFLANLSQAIDLCLAPCMIQAINGPIPEAIESYTKANPLRLALVVQPLEIEGLDKDKLYHSPALVMAPPRHYLQDPKLKQSLWKSLRELLAGKET